MNSNAPDSHNLSHPEQSWSYGAQKELLELWVDGMDLELLARHLNRKPLEVVVKLSELILKAQRPVADRSAPYFRKPWDYFQNSELRRLHALGKKPSDIADALGRDELGVCFRLLSNFEHVLPRAVVKRFHLDEDETSTNLIYEHDGLTPLSNPENFQPVVLETIDGVETETPNLHHRVADLDTLDWAQLLELDRKYRLAEALIVDNFYTDKSMPSQRAAGKDLQGLCSEAGITRDRLMEAHRPPTTPELQKVFGAAEFVSGSTTVVRSCRHHVPGHRRSSKAASGPGPTG